MKTPSEESTVEPSVSTALDKFKLSRATGVPLVALETADAPAFLAALAELCNGATPLVRWDCVRGLVGVNDAGREAVRVALDPLTGDKIVQAPDALKVAVKFPDRSILYFTGLDRLLQTSDARLAALVIQGIANLRDPFKGSGRTLIIATPGWNAPTELGGNVLLIRDPLPTSAELQAVVDGIANSAAIELDDAARKRAVDALVGLPKFDAEQAAALSVHPDGDGSSALVLDEALLWERKRDAINACPGLSVYEGAEDFAAIAGVENAKGFFRRVIDADLYNAFIFVDEIEKAVPASGAGDTSGSSQEILRGLLTELQDAPAYSGSIFLGPPGAAKSALAKALGAESGKPVIAFDLNGCKGSLVGETGRNLRRALATIRSISGGKACWIATCNAIDSLKPELRRRFKLPVFYFEAPALEEQQAIADLYEKRFGVDLSGLPLGKFTGAEIRAAAELVRDLKVPAAEAAGYIVPVAVSAREELERLEAQADGRFVSANRPGVYRRPVYEAAMEGGRRFNAAL